MKVVFVIFAFLAIAKGQSYSCPSSEDIKPCKCQTGWSTKPSIICRNVNSADLVKAVKNMGGLSVLSFSLENSDIGVLPAEAFYGLEIENLDIFECNLTRLSEDRNRPPLLGLENSLQELEIHGGFRRNSPLTLLSLSHLKKLTVLQLDHNVIPSIGNNWFESGPYSLKEVNIISSNVTTLGSHAFEALEQLQYIFIADGSLTEIKRSMFPMPAQNLRSIDFSQNKLESLPSDIFSKMPALEEVFLEGNKLTTISELVFFPVWSQLEYLYMHGNPINCDSNLRWIYKYRLPEHFDGYCTSPSKLLHKRLQDITLADLE